MVEPTPKVGIISCSGEEIPGGTISRRAVRRVLEMLRPQNTVTLCLPLFLAGEEGERRFARQHPTITVDGCGKLCAKKGTETYSGKVAVSLDVSEILGDQLKGCHRSLRDGDKADEEAAWIIAERIAAEVDTLIGSGIKAEEPAPSGAASCGCSCGSPPPEMSLQIGGKAVVITGLPLIFQHLKTKGISPGNGSADRLLETVRIYHAIEETEESAYRETLVAAYKDYCQQ
jgi:uncharacterized metal-binding protein